MKRIKTTFGIDYDGMITRDIAMWRTIIRMMKALGHDIYVVTMRYPSEVNNHHAPMDFEILSLVDDVIFTCRKAKVPFVEAAGLHIDNWFDDTPKAFFMNADQIWGSSTSEGEVVVPEDPITHPLPERKFTVGEVK